MTKKAGNMIYCLIVLVSYMIKKDRKYDILCLIFLVSHVTKKTGNMIY